MKELTFKKLLIIEEEKDMNKLKIGDYFLYGENIINQLENKKEGQPITYYQVIEKRKNSVEYIPMYDYLEK